MNKELFKSLSNIIGDSYSQVAEDNHNSTSRKLKCLIDNRCLPEEPFGEVEIELCLNQLSNMDCNNSNKLTGMGEREGRVYSNLVKKRHYHFSHGIGRSGDVSALQPKAPGSSAINKLTNSLLLNLANEIGFKSAKSCVLFPMATGMTLVLCMLSLRKLRPYAKYVIWPRIDQKSCFKSIITAGFEPLIIEPVNVDDELQTNTIDIDLIIKEKGTESILCIMTTTSCFAPRVPDDIMKVSKLCVEHKLPHLINNAYGFSLKRCINVIEQACCKYSIVNRSNKIDNNLYGGVWAVVQSTDKNLLVPVGGSFVLSPHKNVITNLSQLYAGRGSGSPSLDVFITLLSMGKVGYKKLMENRELNYEKLKNHLNEFIQNFNQKYSEDENHLLRLMDTKHNPISLAIDVSHLIDRICQIKGSNWHVTDIGSKLFYRSVSGARVIESALRNPTIKTIEGYSFKGFGSSSKCSTKDYINVAAALGQSENEIIRFIDVFHEILEDLFKSKIEVKGDN